MESQPEQGKIEPKTIFRHGYGVYPSIAMLAGMQLDVFTPLKDGPMSGARLAEALDVSQEKLRPLLYALVQAELLRLEDDQFANTPEGDRYLVRGRSTYLGGVHELYSDLWSAALTVGPSIRDGIPHKKHDFSAMSDAALAAFFRGLHAGALATGRQLAASFGFTGFRHLMDVGGGSGGLAIAACQNCPDLRATVLELPRVADIARSFVEEAGMTHRVQVRAADVLACSPEGRFDVAVLRNLIQVLGPDEACRMLRNVGEAIEPGGLLIIVGHILQDSRLEPVAAVATNLVFLSIYDAGQAHTEREHRGWLHDAGFEDIDVQYGAGPGGLSIVLARKTRP